MPCLGKRADRARSPLALYALLELSIALAAALGPLLIDVLHGLYISSGGQLALGFPLATAVRLAISAHRAGRSHVSDGRDVAGGGPCGDGLRGSPASRRRAALRREHAGSGGGSAGQHVLCPGVLRHAENALAGMSGQHRHGAVRAGARAPCCPRRGGPATDGEKCAAKRRRREDTGSRQPAVSPAPCPAYLVYAVAGIAGFAFFLMELVWYRMLGPILGGTTFTFGLILAVALAGIGLGGAAYALFFRRAPVSLHAPGPDVRPGGLLHRGSLRLGRSPGDSGGHASRGQRVDFLGEVGGWAVIAAIVILPAAFVSGVQFPCSIGLLGQGDKDVGKQVGLACSWNTVGAICGVPGRRLRLLAAAVRAGRVATGRGPLGGPRRRSSGLRLADRRDGGSGRSRPWAPRSSPPA